MEDKRQLRLYKLPKPRKWIAGRGGDKELYFDCGACETKAPTIHGYFGYSKEFEDVAVSSGKDGVSRLMLLCGECYGKYEREAAAVPEHQSGQCSNELF